MRADLQHIPGIGKNMEATLVKAGFTSVASLKGQSPDDVYMKDCMAQGFQVDRCALYSYRLAVHFADNDGSLPPDKQNWWDFCQG